MKYGRNKVVIICGPTATGKTELALQLAKEFNGELVAADSRQVYIGDDIETGKDKDIIKKAGIKIWLYDVVRPGELFSVSQWRKLALASIEDILLRGKLPIVVGGTGLYIKALTQNLVDIDISFDKNLRQTLEKKSTADLSNYLNKLNPQRLKNMNNSDRQNPRRLIRAIEISLSKQEISMENKYEYISIGLTASKETLIQRIKERVKARGLDIAFEKKEINIMKKQLTWFKKQPNIKWYNLDDAKKD